MPTNTTTIVRKEETEIIPDNITNDTQEQVVPRRSGRVVRQPDRFMFLGESPGLISGEQDSDPRIYNEALKDKDVGSLQKAMKPVMGSNDPNQVWELLEPPSGVRSNSLKLVCKRKRRIRR
jgi:hypothetical protein